MRCPERLAGAALVALLLLPPAALPAAAEAGSAEDRAPAAQPLRDGVQVRLRPADPEARAGAVDDSVLRFWAARGNRARVEDEIHRLQAKHPGWKPPADLFGPVSAVDEGPLWALYDRGDYDAVRAEIKRLREVDEDWSPPANLLALIETHEVRAELSALEQAGDWRRLIAVAEAHPRQIECAAIDNMWRVARAWHEQGEGEVALEVYARIVEECHDLEHRIATLQKASGQVGEAEMEGLVARALEHAASPAERRRIGELRRRLSAPEVPEELQRIHRADATLADAQRAAAAVLSARDAGAAERLGWLHLDAGEAQAAAEWFQRALEWAPTTKRAEGLARAWAFLGRVDDVDGLATDRPELMAPLRGELRAAAIARAFEHGDHARVLQWTARTEAPELLNMRGWTYLRLERPTEAALAFERVLDDDHALPSARRQAAYGLANARLAIGNYEQALELALAHRLPQAQHNELRAEVLVRRAERAFQRQDYRSCVALLEERRSFAEPSRELLLREAWARYHLGQHHTAARIFERLDRVYSTSESAQGLAVVGRAINRAW
jgi:cellulose synthase operon protein C